LTDRAVSEVQGNADFVVVGNSHASNMRGAYERAEGLDQRRALRSTFDFLILTHRGRPSDLEGADEKDTAWRFDVVRNGLTNRRPPRAVVSMLFGNHHRALALAQYSQPADVHVPGHLELGATSGAQIVPYDLVFQRIAKNFNEQSVALLREMAAARPDAPVAIVPPPPPPPVQSDDYPLERGSSVVKRYLNAHASPLRLRLKLWLINRNVLQDAAQSLGLRLLDLPADVFDSEGFLAESYWGDGLHGNRQFYRRMLHLIEDTFAPAEAA
jgi:hypothetical protein